MNGIYCYLDLETDEIVYIGKDSNIDRNIRKGAHRAPSKRNAQPFNQVLQNNLERYQYIKIIEGEFDNDALNDLEMTYIATIDPKFNFTIGGDGLGSGQDHPLYGKRGKDCQNYRHDLDDDIIIDMYVNQNLSSHDIAEKLNTSHKTILRRLKQNNIKIRSKAHYGEDNHMYGKRGKDSPFWKDYPRIRKDGLHNGKQGYALVHNGKRITRSIDKAKLERKLEEMLLDLQYWPTVKVEGE